jgi:tetratricopeptide (TPR) repeat protein
MSIPAQLGHLESAGLIRLAALEPEVEYLFRHGLVQEAAYFSLVKGDRRALHHAVGETLERLYLAPATRPAAALLPELAHHFAEANDAPRALDYCLRAGDAAAALYANAEAIAHYTRALVFALPGLATTGQLNHLFDRRGRVQELSGQYEHALDNYAQMEAAGRQRGDRRLSLAGLTRRAVVHAVPSDHFDPERALSLSGEALAEAALLGDQEAEARLHWARLLAYAGAGDAPAAVAAGEQALTLARGLQHRELLASTLTDLSRMFFAIGRPADGLAALTEAADLWCALGNLPMLAETYTNTAGYYFYQGQYQRALDILAEGLVFSQSIGNAWGQAYNLMQQFFILFDRGDFSLAIRAMRECLRLGEEGGFVYPLVTGQALLGLIFGLLGQPEEADHLLRQAQYAVETILPVERPSLVLIWAWLRLLQDDLAAAEAFAAEGRRTILPNDYLSPNLVILTIVEAELAVRRGRPADALQAAADFAATVPPGSILSTFQPDLLRVRGAALLALDRLDEAETILLQARALADSQPSYRAQWQIGLVLLQVAARRNDPALTEQRRAETRPHLDYLLAHIDEPELRASFLRQPDVRALLEAAA